MTTLDGGGICLDCGICCNGGLHTWGRLSKDEVEPARRAGLRVYQAQPGEDGFRIPCPMHKDNACTVYDERPATCRSYKCNLLQDFESGAISQEAAHAIAKEGRRMMDVLRGLFPKENWNDEFLKQLWAVGDNLTAAPEAIRKNGRALLEIAAYNVYIQRYFVGKAG